MPLTYNIDSPDSLQILLSKIKAIAQINKENLEFIESRRGEHVILKHQYSLELKKIPFDCANTTIAEKRIKTNTWNDESNKYKVENDADESDNTSDCHKTNDDMDGNEHDSICKLLDHKTTKPINDLIEAWKYDGPPMKTEQIAFNAEFINTRLTKYEDLIRLNQDFTILHDKYSRILNEQPESIAAAHVLFKNLEQLHVTIGEIHAQTLDAKDSVEGNESISNCIKMLSQQLKLLNTEIPQLNILLNQQNDEGNNDDERSQKIVEFQDCRALCDIFLHNSNKIMWAMKSFTLNDRQYLACALDDYTITVWDLISQSNFSTLMGHEGAVYALDLYKHGGVQMLASGSKDKSIKLWNLSTCTIFTTLHGHMEAVRSLVTYTTTNNDGIKTVFLVSGSVDKTIKIWNLDTNTAIATLLGHSETIMSLLTYSFNHTPFLVSGGDWDGKINIWNLNTKTLVKTLAGNCQRVCAMVVVTKKQQQRQNGKTMLLACGSWDGIIEIWDLEKEYNQFVATVTTDISAVSSLAVVNYGGQLCLISSEISGQINIWNLEDSRVMATINIQSYINSLITFNMGGQPCLGAGCKNGNIQIWMEFQLF